MDYASLQQDTAGLLQEEGQPVTIAAPGGSYNVATSSVTPSGAPAVATVGVLLPLSRGLRHTPGTDIQAGDMRLLLPGSIAQPAVDCVVTLTKSGRAYTITEVTPLEPAGVAVLFDCLVRATQ